MGRPRKYPRFDGAAEAHPEYVKGYTVGHEDGRTVGFGEGRATGIAEAGDPATLKAARDEGYQAGLLAGRPKLSLFEAAKKASREMFAQPVDDLHARIDKLERQYDEKLSPADRDLVAGVHRRLVAQARLRAEAAEKPNEPRREVPPAPVTTGEPERKATEYELVR